MNEAAVSDNGLSVLFVCTGNICRSPIGERVVAGLAAKAGVAVDVRSAGVGAMNGHAMHPHAVSVLTEHGFDADGFEARYLQPRILKDVDVVLCMTREHRAACQKLMPVRWKRMFTVVEFAELAGLGSLGDIMASRGKVDPNSRHLDIDDPMGRPRDDFVRVYNELRPHAETVVEWLARQREA